MLKIVSASIYGGKNVAFQQTITCPNSTMETLEKGVQSQHYVQNMFKVNNKNNFFSTFSNVSIDELEQVIVCPD